MTYEWEGKITQELLGEIEDMLPAGTHLIGLAVEGGDVEGALVLSSGMTSDPMARADLIRDVYGDVQKEYADSLYALFSHEKARK